MQIMSGLNPTYTPGEFVFLTSPMPGFPDGTRFKVVAARGVGAGQYRYELQANGQTVWVLEADLRSTPPPSIADAPGFKLPDRNLSMTQRMQTMTLSQRMAALGLGEDKPEASTTQRLKILTAERMDGGDPAPAIDGPITGSSIRDNDPAMDATPENKTGAKKP